MADPAKIQILQEQLEQTQKAIRVLLQQQDEIRRQIDSEVRGGATEAVVKLDPRGFIKSGETERQPIIEIIKLNRD